MCNLGGGEGKVGGERENNFECQSHFDTNLTRTLTNN